jgi:hypothetical protein
MADPVPAGSDVSAGTYKCTNCGYELQVDSTDNLPRARAARTANTTPSAEATAATIPTPTADGHSVAVIEKPVRVAPYTLRRR